MGIKFQQIIKARASYWLFVLLTTLFMGYVLYLNFGRTFYSLDVFRLKVIKVLGLEYTQPARLVKNLPLSVHHSLIFLNKSQIRKKIEENPRLKVLDISREFPDTLVLNIEEKESAYILRKGDAMWEIDARLNPLGNDQVIYNPDKIYLHGLAGNNDRDTLRMKQFLNHLDMLPEEERDLLGTLSEVVFAKDILLYPRNVKLEINLGMHSSLEKVRKARYALQYMQNRGFTARRIDLRYGILKFQEILN